MIITGSYYGVLISGIFLIFVITLFLSIIKNRHNIKLYSILLREDGRVSKVSVAFLFVLPVILYQAIYLKEITPGLDYILLTIFGTELGVKVTDKIPDIFNRKQHNKYPMGTVNTNNNNPYKDL